MDCLTETLNWYLFSPIYHEGAYLSFYSSRDKGPIYPEITAYSISLSCLLYARKGDARFLERAKASAAYMSRITRDGGVPSFSDNLLYTFDTGIYISGVFDLYALTKEEKYLAEAERSLNWILRLWDEKPFFSANEIPADAMWYHLPAVHLAKLSIPLLKASKYLSKKDYSALALGLLNKYKKLQTIDGAFRLTEDSPIIMTHPHCYATEGFLYGYGFFKEKWLLETAESAADWLINAQNSDGSLYRSYDVNNNTKEKLRTTDAVAQSTRIWKLLGVDNDAVEKSYRYLESELNCGGLRLFNSGALTRRLTIAREPVYSWPTFFYLHSLLLPFGDFNYWVEVF